MLDFSLDQHGSRFLQNKLDTLSPEDLAAAFRCGGGAGGSGLRRHKTTARAAGGCS